MPRTTPGFSALGYLLARAQKKLRRSAIRDSSIHTTSAIESGCQIVDVEMGRHSFCGYDCVILNTSIGSFCSISDNVYIGGSAHPMHYVSTSPVFLSHRDSVKTKFSHHQYYKMPRTTIGHDVWIGHGAKLRAGITVGHGAVVGMGAVVAKDVPPYAVVVGNPAKEVKQRFTAEIVDGLLRSEWWNFTNEELRESASLFTDPAAFLKSQGLL